MREGSSQRCKSVENINNIICFSHLRWDFVFQRPQHLLTRFSKTAIIYYIEEPIFDENIEQATYSITKKNENIVGLVPVLPSGFSETQISLVQRSLLQNFLKDQNIRKYAFWYYTPMALDFSDGFDPEIIIYDCMDELSNFKFAPENLKKLEKDLFNKADVVFTGGYSLYEAKKNYHSNIYPFPSSIDKEHFSKARKIHSNPSDQINTSNPVLGYFGVIDERFDIELIKKIADAKPNWELVVIGPVVKIDADILPKNKNIHYLGAKKYADLPNYIAAWNIALIPFLLNESTEFISPTKTPEYLAAGLPVISTPIKDVVGLYGNNEMVHICASAAEFIFAAEKELSLPENAQKVRQEKVDEALSQNSWDTTFNEMKKIITDTYKQKVSLSTSKAVANV